MKRLGALNHGVALSRATRRSKPAREEMGGAECREQFRPPAKGEVFSLDIPFYRTDRLYRIHREPNGYAPDRWTDLRRSRKSHRRDADRHCPIRPCASPPARVNS